jgi:hypothetical protein
MPEPRDAEAEEKEHWENIQAELADKDEYPDENMPDGDDAD